MGVPMGAEMSMPLWKAPSPLNGSSRSPKELVMGPWMGQSEGALASSARLLPTLSDMVSAVGRPVAMLRAAEPLSAEVRRARNSSSDLL